MVLLSFIKLLPNLVCSFVGRQRGVARLTVKMVFDHRHVSNEAGIEIMFWWKHFIAPLLSLETTQLRVGANLKDRYP